MKFLIDVLKGVVMGIANIIPGVSGGTMAVTMGIYDKMIGAINKIFKKFVESIKILIPIGIGMVLGIVLLSFIIEKMLADYPLQTNCVFIGLILGGFPIIVNRVKGKKITPVCIIAFIAFFALIIVMQLIGGEENVATIKMSVIEVIKLFAVGIVASATMIIPGVSGSMMLMILGYYAPILESINDFIRCLTKVDVAGMLDAAKILFPFGIGVLVGIVLIAKLVEYLFNHFEKETFYGILGLLAASPIAILMNTGIDNVGAVTVIASLVCLVVGYGIARVLTKLDSE
ncbi:MAG: DUF368 domain-containing protein [Lachnospiraceae bacterium]|nr:DUF368 domain-containing protein [Lachnospiraceae bacterium]